MKNSRVSKEDINPKVEYKIFKSIGIGGGFYFGYLFDEKTKFGDSDGAIRKTDLGLSASIRVYVNSFYAIVSYNHGLQNITNLNLNNIQVNSNNRNGKVQCNTSKKRRITQLSYQRA